MNKNREEKMNFRKIITTNATLLILTLLSLNMSFAEIKPQQTIAFPGVIEQVSVNLKYIVVNETIISLPLNTKIMDEKENTLNLHDLKPGGAIHIEVIKKANG